MQQDWLTKLVFDTKLAEHAGLTALETTALRLHLPNNLANHEIAAIMSLSSIQVSKLIENAFGKILISTSGLLVKSRLLTACLQEKKQLEQSLAKPR